MKNAFHGLISRLNTAEERTSETEDFSKEISKNRKAKRRKIGEKIQRIQGLGDNAKR